MHVEHGVQAPVTGAAYLPEGHCCATVKGAVNKTKRIDNATLNSGPFSHMCACREEHVVTAKPQLINLYQKFIHHLVLILP
jgi:hypothetical protein